MVDEFDRSELERVISAAEIVAGSRLAAIAWFERPLKALGDQSPAELVSKGRAEAVLAYLDSVESGFLG